MLSAVVTAAACAAFTYALDWLTGGQYFIGKNATEAAVNGIPFWAVILSGGLLSSAVTVLFLWDQAYEQWGVYLCGSVFTYVALLFACVFCVYSGPFEHSPLNRFDFLFYAVILFPVGFGGGVVLCFFRQTAREIKEAIQRRGTK